MNGESPAAGAASGPAGSPDGPAASGWFGNAGDAAVRPGASRSDATEILGSRIGGGQGRIGRNPGPGFDPSRQGRITWGTTDQAGQTGRNEQTRHAGIGPAHARPAGARPAGARPGGTEPGAAVRTGADRAGADPYDDRTDVLPPFGLGTEGPHGTEGTHGTHGAGDADRTDVLPPVASAAPAAPTRAFPAGTTAPVPVTAALRDPWQETPDADADAGSGAAGHAHDPHEVTVQLDAVQLGDGTIRRADSGQHRKRGPEGSDGPVFVDASGRRSRLYRRIGIAFGMACAVYAVVIVSTLLSGNSNAPWLPVEGQQEGKPAGRVDTTPLPSESAEPSGTGGAAPGTSPSAGAGVTTAPDADAPAPGTSATARQPGAGTDPGPSRSGADTQPGGGGATAPDPAQSSQAPPPVTTNPSTPAGGGGDPTVLPTQPTGGTTTDPGDDTTANGASDPLAAARTSSSLFPENTL
ncbi:hypothetical protein [Streptomyces sp. BK79]|uniref:hypothetical protein n=1 Tax=Streptomyces sp. BK79 TaxID=3350097 RepID=UPI00376F9620